jgi:chromosome segregation ATPase
MELPIIVFILLFLLVIILILLHRSNKKRSDKISVLEQTLDMKVDAITSLKETYAASRRALDEHAAQANEIADKKQKIQKLQENKASLKATIVEKSVEIEKHYEKHAKSAETTRQTIAKFNTEAQAQVRVIDGLKHLHKEEIREADKKMNALEETINSKTTKNRELSSLLTQTIIEKKEEKKRLDSIISNNNKIIETLKSDNNKSQEIAKKNYAQYEAKLVAKDEETAKLNTVFNDLVEELQEDVRRLEENVANKTQTIEELEARYAKTVQNYEENIHGLKEQIDVQSKKIETLITEHKVAEKDALRKREILEQNIVLHKENIQSLEVNVANKKHTIEELEARYAKTVQNYEDNIRVLKEVIDVESKKMASLIEKHKIEQKEASDRRESLENNILSLDDNIQNLEANITSKKDTIEELELKYKESVDTYDKEIINLKEEITTEHNKIETLIEEHKTEVEAYELQNTQNEKVIQDKLEIIVRLEKDNENQVIKINGLEEDKILKSNEYENLYKEFKASEKEAEKQKDLLEQNIVNLQKHIEKLDNNIVVLKENIESKKQTVESLEHQYTETVDKYDEKIRQLKKHISAGNSKIEGLILEHRIKVEAYESQNIQNKDIIQNKLEAIALLEKNNANYRMQINKLEEEKIVKKDEYSLLEKQYTEAKLEAKDKIRILEDTILNKTKELQTRNSSLEQMKLAYEHEHDKLASTLIDHAREISILEEKTKRSYEISVSKYAEYDRELAKIIDVKEQLEIDKNRQIVALNKTMLETQQTLTSLHKSQERKALQNEHEIVKLSQQIQENEEKNRQVQEVHSDEKKEFLERIDKLKKDLLVKEESIDTLRDSYAKRVQSFEIEKDDLENTIVELDQMYEGIMQSVNKRKNSLTKPLGTSNHVEKKSTQLEKRQQIKEDILSELKTEKVNVEAVSTHDEVMRSIRAGEAKGTVSKKLGIPIKRIELIIKFDKIQQKSKKVL